ncbi:MULTISPECIES: hypothetical protein [Streptomyces]|uniref:hypothetical protein n=1 Tax=Streptomyces TaxID=1883 RepID=UPI001F0BAAF2|nr:MULTISPECIES: hypothetical protein [Streptomyces]
MRGRSGVARWLLSRDRRAEAEALITRYGIEIDIVAEAYGAPFVLWIGAGVLALGGHVSHFLAPETRDLDLAVAARASRRM